MNFKKYSNNNNYNNKTILYSKYLNSKYDSNIEKLIINLDKIPINIETYMTSLILCSKLNNKTLEYSNDIIIVFLISISNILLNDFNNLVYDFIISEYKINKNKYIKIFFDTFDLISNNLFVSLKDITPEIFYSCLDDYNNSNFKELKVIDEEEWIKIRKENKLSIC